MRVLGIESSCDETALALVREEGGAFVVEKNLVASQVAAHAPYGGVVPELAAREHVGAAFRLLEEIGVARDGEGIDAIAVTSGPGLVPALRVGVELAKALAWAWKKPLVAVNHLEGHFYSAQLAPQPPAPNPSGEAGPGSAGQPPTLALLVSGGHTELVLAREEGTYERLGATRDDAAGEAFDKAAKLLGLGYPGGPALAKLAEQGQRDAIAFPRPMIASGDLDFSFSGLKTALAVYLSAHPSLDEAAKADVCASYEEAIVDVLTEKSLAAIRAARPRTFVLAGGVSANARLRARLEAAIAALPEDARPAFLPAPRAYTGDNAAMIAAAGAARFRRGDVVDPLTLEADPNLKMSAVGGSAVAQ